MNAPRVLGAFYVDFGVMLCYNKIAKRTEYYMPFMEIEVCFFIGKNACFFNTLFSFEKGMLSVRLATTGSILSLRTVKHIRE